MSEKMTSRMLVVWVAGVMLEATAYGQIRDGVGGRGVSVDGGGNAYVTGCTAGGLDGNTSAGKMDLHFLRNGFCYAARTASRCTSNLIFRGRRIPAASRDNSRSTIMRRRALRRSA